MACEKINKNEILEMVNQGAQRCLGPVERQFWKRVAARGWLDVAIDLSPNRGMALVVPLREGKWDKQSEDPIWVSVLEDHTDSPYHLYVAQVEGHAQPDYRDAARRLRKRDIFPGGKPLQGC